ncbi:MAG TPA: hypothetical protein VFE56_01420, partial [Candidatus Binataceae bacterium]|nr:hypothetical protein [Candidatus Binataceae bacterium]
MRDRHVDRGTDAGRQGLPKCMAWAGTGLVKTKRRTFTTIAGAAGLVSVLALAAATTPAEAETGFAPYDIIKVQHGGG